MMMMIARVMSIPTAIPHIVSMLSRFADTIAVVTHVVKRLAICPRGIRVGVTCGIAAMFIQ